MRLLKGSRSAVHLMAIILIGMIAVQPSGLLDDFSRVGHPRAIAPQLSITTAYRPCSHINPRGGSIPRTRCLSETDRTRAAHAVSEFWPAARRQLRARAAAEALRTLALLYLLSADSSGRSADESVSALHAAVRHTDSSSAVLTDLSAAYLVRAEQTQNPRDLLEAMVAAQKALQREPRSPAARFNLALALDWYGLDGQARNAWEQYLALDSRSGWAEEARSRLRALAPATATAPRPPAFGALVQEFEAYALHYPQEARLYGWDTLLRQWGEAVLAGDTARAGDRLRLAQTLGETLLRRGGDATLSDAVRAIRTQSIETAATRTLAQAHVEYATGQSAYYAVDYTTARAHFAHVLEIRPPSRALQDWGRLFHAAMLAQGGDLDEAERLLRLLITRTNPVRHPALAGRSRWVLGTVLLRDGQYEAALQHAEDGARLLGRIGETEHLGGAQYVAADAHFYLGATFAGHAAAHRALTTLRPYRGSVWLLNALAVAARTAEADGLTMAAIRLQDERVALAERIAQPVRIAEARMGRGRLLAAAGMLDQAWAAIEASQPLLDSLSEGARAWLKTELHFARADYFAVSQPDRAAANLDSVLATADGSLIAPRRLRARVGRAAARLALRDVPGATADLDTASLLLVQERDAIANTEYRASLVETARGVFDRLSMLGLAAGDTLGALRYLERGRTSFSPTERGTLAATDELPRTLPGQMAVVYALVEDTLLTWTVAGASVRLVRQTVDRRSFVGTVEDLRLSLERGEDTRSLRPVLAALYDQLVKPVETRLGDESTTLVVVADGELASVPFSALYDGRNSRYLVEDHPLRYAGSLRDAARTREGGTLPGARTLLIADPAFDPRMHPGLARLPGARLEVDSIAVAYRNHTVLTDSSASRHALEAAFPGTSVVHFAGHAIFDDQRPERSYLVLAPEDAAAGHGWLTAGEMEDLPLRHVDLFVLSACQTLRSRSGRAGGFAGFAGALLDAGTGGVVGSLWRIDDRLTAPLMVEFHRAYRRSGNGPRALREAQLRLLRSPDPALRSPAAWAGFRYAGN